MQVRELLAALNQVNPDAEIFVAPTNREEDLLPITGLEMKVPSSENTVEKTEHQIASKVALRIPSFNSDAALQEIAKMQHRLQELMARMNEMLNQNASGN